VPRYVHRTQILLDEDRMRALRERARETGRPVAELICAGIDRVLEEGLSTPEKAVEDFLSGPDVELGDAGVTKREVPSAREP